MRYKNPNPLNPPAGIQGGARRGLRMYLIRAETPVSDTDVCQMIARKSSHSVFSIYLHFVFVTKYRKKIINAECTRFLQESCALRLTPNNIREADFVPPSVTKTRRTSRNKRKEE